MAFATNDFHELVRLLTEHPEWRAELRRLVLSDELLALPDLMRDLAQEVRELAAAQRRAEERLARVEQGQTRLEARQDRLEEGQARLEIQVAELRGDNLERRYREHAGAYFGALARRAHALTDRELAELLGRAEDQGVLSADEVDDVRRADVVVRGRRRDSAEEVYLVIEVSAAIGPGDVERAARRAALLRKVQETLPVVAGERVTPKARDLAAARGVWAVLDGRTLAPESR